MMLKLNTELLNHLLKHITGFCFFLLIFSNSYAQLLWSDPTTWGGTKPLAGEDVVIPEGTHILLDEDTPALGGLTINGTLELDRQDLHLTADWIMVTGRLEVGTETQAFTQQATITLTDDDPNADIMGMGTRAIMVMGGTLELHGNPPVVPWTKINANAPANSTSLTLMEGVNWSAGDQIAIGPTDYFEAGNGASVTQCISLSAVNGTMLDLAEGLNAFRWGVLQYATPNGMSLTNENLVMPPATSGFTPTVLDERAPIGNLTRNILIQAPDDALWNKQGFGCHIMIMRMGSGVGMEGVAHLNGVEIRRAGQRGNLGRYPFHWHMLSYEGTQTLNDATGQYIRHSVINGSQNRGIVIHGTNGVEVADNIVYDVRGHGIFTEDAVERRNVIDGNLVLLVRNPNPGFALKQHEASTIAGRGSSGFWISNPDNTVINNTAADCQTSGFWLAFPTQAWGLSQNIAINPSRILFGTFDNNTAHSNGLEGILLDWVEIANDGTIQPHQYQSTIDGQNPVWPYTTLRRFELGRYKTWKNASHGIWDRAVWADNYEVVSADNCGRFFAGSGADGIIERSLVVGTSLNHLMNGTDRPNFTGAPTPSGFATYHSTFDIRDNIAINFQEVANTTSGVFATDDYYIRPVEKGQLRNVNNLIINSHPGVKLEASFPHFALAGALWDPHATWGDAAGDWLVYDEPFFTDGQLPTPVAPGAASGGVLVEGPFYGFNEFVVNQANIRWEDIMEIEVTRMDTDFNPVDNWVVEEAGSTAWLLAHMRHFAAHPDGFYHLEFPTIGEVNDVGITVTNMLTTEDVLLLGIEYSGNYAIEQVYTSSVWDYMGQAHTQASSFNLKHVYTPVNSRQAVIDSAGETYWHDTQNGIVWIKIQGGIDQPFNDTDFDSWDDELLYRLFYLRIWGAPAPLAVEGLNFSTKVLENNKILLEWTKPTSINGHYFVVERSKDAQNWQWVEKVPVSATTNSQDYSTIDHQPFKGKSYYRIQYAEANGVNYYSETQVVNLDNTTKLGDFYPNPSKQGWGFLNYWSNTEQLLDCKAFDAMGQQVYSLVQVVKEGTNVLKFDFTDLNQGVFFVKIEDKEQIVLKQIVLK